MGNSMGKQKHFFTLFLGTGLNILLGVITTPVVTRLVNPDVFGGLSLFTLFGNILLIICSLGQDQAYNRFYYSRDDDGYRKYLLGLTAKTPLTISIAVSIIIVLYYIFSGSQNYVMLIFAVYTISMVVDRFSSMTLRLKMRSGLYSLTLNMQKLAYTLLVVIAVSFTEMDHLIILTASTVLAQIVSCIIGIVAEKKMWSIDAFFPKKDNEYRDELNKNSVFKYSWPFIFASLCSWIFTGSDKVMIGFLCDNTQLGIYASAVSVIGIFSVITNTFTTIWAPMAIEEYEKKSGSKEFFVKATDYISIVLFAAGATVILLKDVIIYLLGAEYREAVFLIPFLSLYPVLYTISESTVYGINFSKKTHLHVIIMGSCATINIILNFLLINLLGSLGAAVATGITYTILLILRTALSVKCFPVAYNIKKIAVMLVLYYIFVIYNSIFKINMVSVIMFLIIAAVGIILYKKSILELLEITFEYIKDIIGRFKKKK